MVSLKVKEVFCVVYSGCLFASGILMIAFTIVLTYKLLYHFTFIPSNALGPSIVLFLLGFTHLFLTWLGIKGPTREHNFHIILFIVFASILLISEFAVGVWSVVLRDEIELETIDLMSTSFKQYRVKLQEDKKSWGKVQSQLKCCGLKGSSDFASSEVFPAACFINEVANNSTSNASQFLVYEEGCKVPFIKYVKAILIESSIVGFVAALFQGLGIFLVSNFFKTLRQERALAIEHARSAALANAAQMPPSTSAPPSAQSEQRAPYPITTQPSTPPVTSSS